jgi:hypothetical protein
MFQSRDELSRPERPARVRVLAQRRDIGGRFSLCKMLAPFSRRPAFSPALHFQQAVRRCQSAVRSGARPSPLRGRGHHLRAHRIQLHIAQGSPQVSFVEGTRIESPLPHVPARRIARVPIRCVASVGVLESLRQGFGSAGNRDQVHVIRHEAVTEHRKMMKRSVLPHQFEVSDSASVIVENYLPGVSPLGNMMGNVNHNDAREAGHSQKLSEKRSVRDGLPPNLWIGDQPPSHAGPEKMGNVPSVAGLSEMLLR